jgi:DNA-binding transcriptional regulator YdaS (Cro superfamily)
MNPFEALQKVISLAGSQEKLKESLGLKSQGAISNMVRRQKAALPQVLTMEKLYGVSRHDLRPDYYPRERRR